MPFGTIDYWVDDGRAKVQKTVHHFVRDMRGGALSTDGHEVSEVAWIPLNLLDHLLANVERDLVAQAASILVCPDD